MKKLAGILIVTTLSLTLAACGGSKPAAATAAGSKLGIGVITGIGSSKDATDEKNANAQVDSLIAAVTIDDAGKITKCVIDAAQTKIEVDKTGKIISDLTSEIKTKNELGADYGMKAKSGIQKEWNEQAAAFAEWTIGKTADEVKGLKVKEGEKILADDPALTSSVTVSVDGFQAAVIKAVNNAK